jgi:hypothetical protein
MLRRALAVLVLAFLGGGSASAKDPMAELPAPVASYAERFDKECRDQGLGHVVLSDNYADRDYGFEDVNADGVRDYFIYKCMFGCSGKPQAFTGLVTPCPFGALLLSGRDGHSEVFIPGMVRRARLGPALLVKLQRPRALRLVGNFCTDPFADYDPEYVYELKDKRFVLLGMCPQAGAGDCLSGIGSKTELKPGHASSP